MGPMMLQARSVRHCQIFGLVVNPVHFGEHFDDMAAGVWEARSHIDKLTSRMHETQGVEGQEVALGVGAQGIAHLRRQG